MTNLTLEVLVDNHSLAALNKMNAQFVLSRKVISNNGKASSALAWFAMTPSENNTTLSWTEAYYLYATTNQVNQAKPVIVTTAALAKPARLMHYSEGEGFQSSTSQAESMAAGYGLLNLSTQHAYSGFGLAQALAVNGLDQGVLALNLLGLEPGQQVWLTPDSKVLVSVVTGLTKGASLQQPGANSIMLNLDATTPHQRLFFDVASQIFSLI